MGKFKTVGSIIAIILSVFFLFSIGFYYLITMVLPEKYVDWTVNVSELANVPDDNNRVIYVKYYSNKNGNGVELLDIKINGYIDANQINNPEAITYSKGIQLVGTEYGSIDFTNYTKYKHDTLSVLFGTQQVTYQGVKSNITPYFYDTQNGISTPSIVPLSADDVFKVSVGNELYLMKLLGEDVQSGDQVNAFWMSNINTKLYDQNAFAMHMLQICKSNSAGLDSEGLITKSCAEMFAYKKYNDGILPDKWLTSIDLENDGFIVDFTNNVTIHVQSFSDGAKTAQDSLFGIIEDKSDFEYINKGVANDYFNGTQHIDLNENCFRFVNVVGNKYVFAFSQQTIEFLNQHKNKINITIDKDVMTQNNIELEGFDQTVTQYKDRINFIRFKSVDTNTGEVTYEGVTLWIYF